LKILKQGGETALLNETIAITGKAGEDFSALLAEVGSGSTGSETKKVEEPKAEESKVEASKPVETAKSDTPTASNESGRLLVSPIAAKMATENGIDLRTVSGSGPQGRIIKRDIEAAMESPKPKAQSTTFTSSQVFGASASREEPASKMRQVIAERLTASTQNIPHFYLTVEIEMDNVLALRKQINASVKEEQKVSVNDIIVKAAAMALIKHPWVNASFQGKSVKFYEDADISVAVAIEDGLITPVVRAANKKGILAISAEIKELAGRAKAKKLQPEEYTGGTFSVSNLGMFGIEHFTAIINPPEAAIIAVGGAAEKAVVRNGQIVVRSMMNVTMSCDHRVVDGATGAKFLQTFKQMLESPAMMLL
jgi:pyruvate dehydrogenase E2 component (dihydrolipoamide acetyltransferase)